MASLGVLSPRTARINVYAVFLMPFGCCDPPQNFTALKPDSSIKYEKKI